MGFFKRKKDEEVKIQLEREALDKLNGNNFNAFDIPDDSADNNFAKSEWQISGKTRAPHTITAEELNSKAQKSKNDTENHVTTEEIPMSNSEDANKSPSDFLYQKMINSRAKLTEESIEESDEDKAVDEETSVENNSQYIVVPEEENKPYVPLDINAAINDLKNSVIPDSSTEEASEIPEVLDENAAIPSADTKTAKPDNFVDNTKDTRAPESKTDISTMGANAEERRATLLARCNAYLADDSGSAKIDTEKYKLESVESILEGFEARAAEKVNKKFNSASSPTPTPRSTTNKTDMPSLNTPIIKSEEATSDTVIFKAPVNVEPVKSDNSALTNSNAKQVKHIFTAVTDKESKTLDNNEDFSTTRIITDISSHSKPADISSSSKTAIFPIIETIADSSKTDDNNSSFKESDDENSRSHIDDYNSIADRQKILNGLNKNKKKFNIKVFLSILVFIPALFISTSVSQNVLTTATSANIVDLILCLLITAINFDVLVNISSLFSSKANTGLPAALSLIAATLFSVVNLIFKSDFIGFSAIAAFSLLSYNLANRSFYSKTIKNFNIIANAEFKKAISIIQNKNATKTIVGDSIEGSVLVCYGGETTNIRNFLRYTYCKNPISEKIQKLSLISIIIGIGLALATLFLIPGNKILPIYIFATAVCFSAIPSVYHIVSLTINCANKRLNHYDAMITGYRAADELDLCNGIAVSSEELFPEGTIRLVDMKLLSPNPFDQSMLDAAAVATAIHSPITGIFKQMDTSKSYNVSNQEVDSVIYEEKMGISGWVNDRRVFVGNRDLLIAHGFTGLPPAELDKKIMRKGYFPVYIASDNIPCALLVVKYEPDQDIIYEMQRLANTGTTIIVDNCDPNINAKMLSDYFELYSETVFVMNKQGSDFYRALTPHKEHRNAGAAYKSRIEGLLAALTASINIKKYVSRMSVLYICSIILGLLAVTACIFTSLIKFITPINILSLQLLMTVITLFPTILRKP